MMAPPRIGIHGSLFTVDTSLLSIHAIANGGSEANSGQIGTDVLLGGWVDGYHGTGLRWCRHDGCGLWSLRWSMVELV